MSKFNISRDDAVDLLTLFLCAVGYLLTEWWGIALAFAIGTVVNVVCSILESRRNKQNVRDTVT